MSEYKVVWVYFKEGSSDLQKAINNEANDGWTFEGISTYTRPADNTNKANAVIVFSKG